MHFLEKFYCKTLKYELINKFIYNDTKNMPKLKKIILNFGCKTAEIKQLSSSLLAIELITNQKGTLNQTKHSNILFKIRKGNPTGCKVTLSRFKMFNFFSRTLTEVFPKLKNFTGFKMTRKIKKSVFSYELHDTFSFSELEGHYYLFNNLPKLDITVVTNSTTKKEFIFMLKSFQLPFKN
jgi:large subunit ribosomal protein L5